MSTNVVKVNGDYKIKAVRGGNISLDAGPTGNVSITGNLNVYGSTTNITDTYIKDNKIELNVGEQTDKISLDEAGIQIDRGPTNPYGHAQLLFDERIFWEDPVLKTTKKGLFVFKTLKTGLCGIQTVSINTAGNNLYLINSGEGVISVVGTADYELNVTDDDHIPNKKYVDTRIASGGGGKVTFTQPETAATLTISNNKTLTVNNSITFSGTEGSNPVTPCAVNFGTGGSVAYKGGTLAQFNTTSAVDLAGIISTATKTGTSKLVFNTNPVFENSIAFLAGGVTTTITAVTGSGKMVLSGDPVITNTISIIGNLINSVTGGRGDQVGASLVLNSGPTIINPTIQINNNLNVLTASQKVNGITGGSVDTSANLVFSNGPTLVTPVLGAATATSINKLIITAPATTATLTIANNKSLTVSNNIIFTSTDTVITPSVAFREGGTVAFTSDLSNYVLSTGLTGNVAAIQIPDATTANANTAKNVGFLGSPINTQSGGYILQFGDQGKTIYTTGNIEIPANGTVTFPIGTRINIIANAAISITIVTDKLQWGGQATDQVGTRYLARYGMASLIKVTSTTWYISGSIIT